MSWPYPVEKGSRYNLKLLLHICEERKIVLTKVYSGKLNRDSRIEGKCGISGCNGLFDRIFRGLVDVGPYCQTCLQDNKRHIRLIIELKYKVCIVCDEKFEGYPIVGLNDQTTKCRSCRFVNSCKKTNKKTRCKTGACTECYDRSILSHPTTFYWDERKNFIEPLQVSKGNCQDKYFYNCPNCLHTFEAIPANLCKGHWCPYCSHTKLCENYECTFCKRFSHPRIKFFLEEKNNYINPRDLFPSSAIEYWFQCDECSHEIQLSPRDVSYGIWCKYCSQQDRCEEPECEHCYENLFLSVDECAFVSKNNEVTLDNLARTSHTKILFTCPDCLHDFSASPANVTNGKWCPYCVSRKRCVNYECDFCMPNRFGYHEKSIYWDYSKNIRTLTKEDGSIIVEQTHPLDISMNDGKKRYFICENNHSFSIAPICITLQNQWCSKCPKRKTEKKMLDWLETLGTPIIYDKPCNWCINPKTKKKLRYDFVLEEYKLIIELDGRQHWEEVNAFEPLENIQYRDNIKENFAEERGYTLIRIKQPDVWLDKYDWKATILETITEQKNTIENQTGK